MGAPISAHILSDSSMNRDILLTYTEVLWQT